MKFPVLFRFPARLFHEPSRGPYLSGFAQARAGDFIKIWWSTAVSRRKHDHLVVFPDTKKVKGVVSVRFWSSNIGVGYSEKAVPISKAGALACAASLNPSVDPYLTSLPTKGSSVAEVLAKCGR